MLTIRPMTVDDIAVVSQIDKASFSLPWPERSFKYELTENEHSIPLVAELSDSDVNCQIIGFIVVWLIVDEAHIGTVAVMDAFRKTGAGEQLVRRGLQEARERGAAQAFLEVRKGNLGAIHLYEKLGFQVDGIRYRYYQDNHEDAVLMSLGTLSFI